MEKIYKLDSAFSFINNPRGMKMKKAFPKINSNQTLSGISPIKNYLKKGAWMYWSLKDETGTYTRMMNLNFDSGLFFRNWDISLYIKFEPPRPVKPVVLETMSASDDIRYLPEEQLNEVLAYEKAIDEWNLHKTSKHMQIKKELINEAIQIFLIDIPDNSSILVQERV